jgi:internalin A
VELALSKGLTALTLRSGALGAKPGLVDLSPLRDFPGLRDLGISVEVDSFKDIDALYESDVTELSIMDRIGSEIDIARVPNLEILSFESQPKVRNAFAANDIRRLSVWHYKGTDLAEVSALENLTYLTFVQSSIKSLEGIQKLARLKELNVAYCRSLADVAALDGIASLEKVKFEKVPKVPPVLNATLPNLRELEWGVNIPNVGIIAGFPSLESFVFASCADDDLSGLLDHPNLRRVRFYPDKKSYSHTSEDINFLLTSRWEGVEAAVAHARHTEYMGGRFMSHIGLRERIANGEFDTFPH